MNNNHHISWDEIFPRVSKHTANEDHLKTCEQCSELVNILKLAREISHSLKPDNEWLHPSTLQLSETITKIYENSISGQEAANFINHVESCSLCFNFVAMTVEESLIPVPDEVLEDIKVYSDISLAEKALQSVKNDHWLHSSKETIERISLFAIRSFKRLIASLKPQPAFGLAGGLALVLVTFFVGQQPFRVWRANVNSHEGIEILKATWTITDADYRPPGDFSKSMFSIPHSASQSDNQDPERASFQTALEWDGENFAALRGLAIYWYFRGNLLRADSLANVLLKLNVADFEAWNLLGLVHARNEQISEALNAFKKALQIKADYAEAAYNRALVLQQFGRFEEAKNAWQEYLEVDQQSEWAGAVRKRIEEIPDK